MTDEAASPDVDSDISIWYNEIEVETILQGILEVHKLRIQSCTFFGAANLAAMSFALTTHIAGIAILAGILLWVFVYIDLVIRGGAIAYYHRLLQIQRTFALDDRSEYLLSTRPSGLDEQGLVKIRALPGKAGRAQALRDLRMRGRSWNTMWALLLASVAEIGIGLALWLHSGWRFLKRVTCIATKQTFSNMHFFTRILKQPQTGMLTCQLSL